MVIEKDEIACGLDSFLHEAYFWEKEFSGDLLNWIKHELGEESVCAGVLGTWDEVLSVPYAERVEDIGKCFDKHGRPGGGKLNTYPFGVPSGLYPDFLGVCVGKTRLQTVLAKAEDHCERAIIKYPNEEKTVIIVTDKWDNSMFRKDFAGTFINFACQNNIVFIILLITDFGISKIPFLPINRNILKRNNHVNVAWGAHKQAAIEQEKAIAKLGKDGFEQLRKALKV